MEALKQPTIRVVAIIAEGVPEHDTKKLIAYARANNKVLNWTLPWCPFLPLCLPLCPPHHLCLPHSRPLPFPSVQSADSYAPWRLCSCR